jgi:AraC-like DNA-binding protein
MLDHAETAAAQPETLRRAVAFIHDNAHRDIGLSDIAAAISITPRSVQYTFRRHLGTTPLEYLRRVRLDRAHRDLHAADPAVDTVMAIAGRWRFGHVGRVSIALQGKRSGPRRAGRFGIARANPDLCRVDLAGITKCACRKACDSQWAVAMQAARCS